MGLRFTALASGSSGNTSLVQVEGRGLLIDFGLGPRQLAERLATAMLSWSQVHAAILTHIHSDHWHERTLAQFVRRGVTVWCHREHAYFLRCESPSFARLRGAGLVQYYDAGGSYPLAPGLACQPLTVRHDGGPTFGFRFEGSPDLFGRRAAMTYAADLGCWDEALVTACAEVDLLALEFNHDVVLERASGRGPRLIARVLGDQGHLSNRQAADLVRASLARSTPGRLRHLVQLHLSRDCNRPALARAAARQALEGCRVGVQTARQDASCFTLPWDMARIRVGLKPRYPAVSRRMKSRRMHPCLPGLEREAI